MKGNTIIHWKAVGLGLAIDIGATLLAGMIISFAVGLSLASQGIPATHIAVLMRSVPALTLMLALGVLTTTGGAFVAGRTARLRPVLNGALVGILPLPLGCFNWSNQPHWYNVVAIGLSVAGGLLGGLLALRFPKAQVLSTATPNEPDDLPTRGFFPRSDP